MNVCVKCGACSVVCPVYLASGREAHTARGKHHLAQVIDHEQIGPVYEEFFSQCLLCGRCTEVCVREIDTPLEVVRARADFSTFYGQHGYTKFLARKIIANSVLFNSLVILGRKTAHLLAATLPADSGLRLKLGLFRQEASSSRPKDLPKQPLASTGKKKITYYPGCVSSYLYPGTIQDLAEITTGAGFDTFVPEGLGCCGLAAWASGDLEGARQLAKKNIEVLEKERGEIVVSCGSCFYQLARMAQLFEGTEHSAWALRAESIAGRLRMLSQFLVNHPLPQSSFAGQQSTRKMRLFYHDPCHLLTQVGGVEQPRQVLGRIPGVELLELADGPKCCGHGGLFSLAAPELSEKIRQSLIDEILKLQPDVITTSCSGCLLQLRLGVMAAGAGIEVLDLSEFIATRVMALPGGK